MIIIHFGTNNSGINMIPVCVTWYDTESKKGAYYVICPSNYWEHNKEETGCPPTYEDCFKYGLSTSTVARKLNESLLNKIVYTNNVIVTKDCLDRIYGSCGDYPRFIVENIFDFIPESNFPLYVKLCSELTAVLTTNFEIFVLVFLVF